MKLLISLLYFVTVAHAGIPPVVKCLAAEEMRIHKNSKLQYHYQLNQQLLNAFVGANDLTLKESFRNQICKNDVALNLLEALLIKGETIFNSNYLIETERYARKIGIYALLEEAPELLFQYILTLQSHTQKPGCLEKKIPELKTLMEQFQHLQVEISRKRLLQNKDQLQTILTKLKGFSTIQAQCRTKK